MLELFESLVPDAKVWAQLTSKYDADLFCGLFLDHACEGFELSPAASAAIADRGLIIGFDIYGADSPETDA